MTHHTPTFSIFILRRNLTSHDNKQKIHLQPSSPTRPADLHWASLYNSQNLLQSGKDSKSTEFKKKLINFQQGILKVKSFVDIDTKLT